VLAVRSLFVYERAADRALVLAAGLAGEWLSGPGVRVTRLATLYGTLTYSLRRLDAHTVRFDIGAGLSAQLVLRPPLAAALRSVTVNDVASTAFEPDSVTLVSTDEAVICIMSDRAADVP
jgi:hypothetical protein